MPKPSAATESRQEYSSNGSKDRTEPIDDSQKYVGMTLEEALAARGGRTLCVSFAWLKHGTWGWCRVTSFNLDGTVQIWNVSGEWATVCPAELTIQTPWPLKFEDVSHQRAISNDWDEITSRGAQVERYARIASRISRVDVAS